MVRGDDAAARRGRLERGVGERIGLGRRHADHVGCTVDVLDVRAKSREAHALGHAELRGERVQLVEPALLALPRVAGDERDRPRPASAGSASARMRTSWPFHVEIRPRIAQTNAPAGRPRAARARSRAARTGAIGSPSWRTRARGSPPSCAAVARETHGRASAVSSSLRYAGQ